MAFPITTIARALSLKKHRSPVETELVPLDRIQKVLILLDSAGNDAVSAEAAIKQYFESKKKEIMILRVTKGGLNWYGRFRRKKDFSEDLLISLYPAPRFEADYEAICSNARFKMGRYWMDKDIFDIVVSDKEKNPSQQLDVFNAMIKILESVK